MSHSRIFQVERVRNNEYENNGIIEINEFNIELNDIPHPTADYVVESDSKTKEDYAWLKYVLGLFDDMFECNDEEMSFVYKNKPIRYFNNYCDELKAMVNSLDMENYGLLYYRLKTKVCRNNLDTMIYTDGYGIQPVFVWAMDIIRNSQIGDKFYMAKKVLDYHY